MVATATGARPPELSKYDVLEEIGHGGMATVYRAHDRRLGRDVAVKVIHPHLRDSPEVAHRFVVEAQAVAKLRHPNIVEVFDVSSENDRDQYLVVELVRGHTLRTLLKEHAPLPPEVAASIAMDLLAALGHAHGEGVVHRDVKPENVLLEHRALSAEPPPSGNEPRVKVKLTDFGIAKLLDAKGVTSTGQVLGSPAHMAPEQIEGGEVDARSDVFGMGVLLYECLVGHLPFEGNNPAQVLRRVLGGEYAPADLEQPTVGAQWSAIVDRALAHDPADRYADASEMREAMAGELARLGVADAREEIATFFDDPEAYATAHEQRMIDVLCKLATAARKEGRALDAARDYNRALAYAPTDPHLLRVVAGMHRAEARARLLRRAAPVALATVALGTAAFFATRALRTPRVKPDPPQATASVAPNTTASAPPSATAPVASATESVAAASASTPPVQTAPTATAIHTASIAAEKAQRKVTLDVRPVVGVVVSLDNGPPQDALNGTVLTFDSHEHTLKFACKGDACEPEVQVLSAGNKDETRGVHLKMKPALLTVQSDDASATFSVSSNPGQVVHPGAPVTIPLTGASGSALVTICDRADPSHCSTKNVIAGQSTKVVFGP